MKNLRAFYVKTKCILCLHIYGTHHHFFAEQNFDRHAIYGHLFLLIEADIRAVYHTGMLEITSLKQTMLILHFVIVGYCYVSSFDESVVVVDLFDCFLCHNLLVCPKCKNQMVFILQFKNINYIYKSFKFIIWFSIWNWNIF